MWKGNTPNAGDYVITEQGDLGLGLTPVVEEDVKVVKDDKEKKDKK